MDTDLLGEIASYAHVEPLPWAELEAQGHGLMESDEYVALIGAKLNAVAAIWTATGITYDDTVATSSDAAATAWRSLVTEFEKFGDTYVAALKRGEIDVSWSVALAMGDAALRTMLVSVFRATDDAFYFFGQGYQRQGVAEGAYSLADAKAYASDTYGLLNAVLLVDSLGLFDSLKKKAATKGLGVLIPAWGEVVIRLVGIAAMAALVWYGIGEFSGSRERIHWHDTHCLDDHGHAIDPPPPGCAEYGKHIADAAGTAGDFAAILKGLGESIKAVGSGLAWAIGIGAVAYIAGVYILPQLLTTPRGRRLTA